VIKQVLLDMDGVLTDFVKHICQLHNRPNPFLHGENRGLFEMDKIWGMSASDFWSPCGYDFWSTMDWMPDAQDILGVLDSAVGTDNVCLLTAPCATAGCVEGKRDWVRKNLPEFSKRLMIGSAKEFMASPVRLLVDDRDENVDKYKAAGGPTFLYPRCWNRNHGLVCHGDLHMMLMHSIIGRDG